LLTRLRRGDSTLVLWTNSRRDRAGEILRIHDLRKYFTTCIFREDYDPDEIAYVKSLGKMGVLIRAADLIIGHGHDFGIAEVSPGNPRRRRARQPVRGKKGHGDTCRLLLNGKDINEILTHYPKALLPRQGKNYVCSLEASESVPPAIDSFMRGRSFPDVLERSLARGNDTDTIAAIACGLAALRFLLPETLVRKVVDAHPDNEKMHRRILGL
jgi:hypothetical protein